MALSKATKSVLVGIPVAFLFATVLIPNFIGPRYEWVTISCVNGLRLIDQAKKKWAYENKKKTNDVPTEDDLRPLCPIISGTTNSLRCPGGGTYTIGAVGAPPRCSMAGEGHTLTPVP